MSAPTNTQLSAASGATGTPTPMRTLVEVEVRKMVDTRAGFWLLFAILAILVIALGVVVVVGEPQDRSFVSLFQVAQFPAATLLPVVGILAATSEWGQRTVLTTFSLTPSRGRIVAAKTLAAIALALFVFVFSLLLAAAAAAIASIGWTVEADWSLGFEDLFRGIVFLVLNVLLGLALGMALLITPLAIVTYFFLPTVWAGVTSIKSLHWAQEYLDTGTTWARLVSDDLMTGDDWTKVLTTALLWIALPLAIGTWRVVTREVD
jgi:ABC-2 type transport system permease protein